MKKVLLIIICILCVVGVVVTNFSFDKKAPTINVKQKVSTKDFPTLIKWTFK